MLSDFLIGPENGLVEVAVDAVLAGLKSKETKSKETTPPRAIENYSPVVICGPIGTGKSHLAHGLLRQWRDAPGRQRAEYTGADDFARQWTDAIDTHGIEDFRRHYRKASLLIVEDVELLVPQRPDRDRRKLAAQDELIHTIDTLIAIGKQVVVTASSMPAELTGLRPELRSRLIAGLVVPLSRPGQAARRALLQEMATQLEVRLNEEVTTILVDGIEATAPELLGALVQLKTSSRLSRRPLNAEMARAHINQRNHDQHPALRDIAVATARFFSLRLSDLRSDSRRRAIVTARGVAMYLARLLTDKSHEQIGHYFGGRDHTTVIHGCRKTEQLIETDPAIRQAIEQLGKNWQKTT